MTMVDENVKVFMLKCSYSDQRHSHKRMYVYMYINFKLILINFDKFFNCSAHNYSSKMDISHDLMIYEIVKRKKFISAPL